MIFFHVALFAALLMGISYRTKEELVDVIPCGVCILVLALYGLCFVNGLAWLDTVCPWLLCRTVSFFSKAEAGEGRDPESLCGGTEKAGQRDRHCPSDCGRASDIRKDGYLVGRLQFLGG